MVYTFPDWISTICNLNSRALWASAGKNRNPLARLWSGFFSLLVSYPKGHRQWFLTAWDQFPLSLHRKQHLLLLWSGHRQRHCLDNQQRAGIRHIGSCRMYMKKVLAIGQTVKRCISILWFPSP